MSEKKQSFIAKILACALVISFLSFGCGSNTGSKLGGAPKVTIYFTKASDDLGVVLIPVLREVKDERTAYETAMRELFLGPTIEEKEKLKLKTEIPEGSRVVKVEESNKAVRIDISSQFMHGGGSETMQVRFRQLRETALNLAKGRPVYLFIDGEKARTIGGEGLEVPQPFTRDETGENDDK